VDFQSQIFRVWDAARCNQDVCAVNRLLNSVLLGDKFTVSVQPPHWTERRKSSEPEGMGESRARVRWPVAEKRRIVELTFAPGASVARVAQAEGVNSHQVFQWRRSYREGGLVLPDPGAPCLLPVVVQHAEPAGHEEQSTAFDQAEDLKQASGAIHIEIPGRALISVEHSADMSLLRVILESLRK